MLKQRVITAAVLLLIVAVCLAAPGRWPFALLITAFISLGAWEWGRLSGLPEGAARTLGLGFALVGAAAALLGWPTRAPEAHSNGWALAWAVYLMAWLLLAVLALRGGVPAWQAVAADSGLGLARRLAGLVVLGAAWAAAVQVFAHGVYFLLTLLALVWVADTGAYIAGKSCGQKFFARKLAPSISPGKSWEGVLGGMLAVLALAAACLWADGHVPAAWGKSFYGVAAQQWGVAALVPLCLLLAAMSVMGDLLESLAKRAAGMKDSSQVLPGHGGVLDRIDGLLPVLPVGALLVALS